ncbi:MAG: holo-ACP synthase [Deltaproteobacteria bacterium]|nr:holo-ACP synthase [Deltaproteobacteria bacterium]
MGIDLVSVSRMKKILGQVWAHRFVERVFTPQEIAQCSKTINPEERFAGKFAAKEAAVKALGTGFSLGISPNQIMITDGVKQRPSILLSLMAKKVAESKGIDNIVVSISHTDGMASAIVIMEKTSRNLL